MYIYSESNLYDIGKDDNSCKLYNFLSNGNLCWTFNFNSIWILLVGLNNIVLHESCIWKNLFPLCGASPIEYKGFNFLF